MKKVLTATTIALLAAAARADNGPYNIVKIVDKSVALSAPSGSPLLEGMTYLDLPGTSNDMIYTCSAAAGGGLQSISGIGTTPVGTQVITASDLQTFYTNNNGNLPVITPLAGSIELNPTTLNFGTFTAAPGTIAIISDSEQTKTSPTGSLDPANTKRLYFWNLYPTGSGHDPALTPILNRDVYNIAAGYPVTATANDNMGLHQFALSSDGQSVYFTDSTGGATGFGGIYKTNIVTGNTTRLETDRSTGSGAHTITAEPGVMSVNGHDRVIFDGSTALGNVGGINYFDDDGSATPAVHTLLAASTLANFVNTAAVPTVGAVITDANGNIYFNVVAGSTSMGTRRVALLRLDPQNRLSKVLSYNEGFSYFNVNGLGSFSNAGVTHMQMLNGASTSPSIVFPDKGGTNTLAQITAYLPGDFNRDGVVNNADAQMLDQTSVLSLSGVATTNVNNFKFDMNADANANASTTIAPTAIVDYADVKIFQQFYPFADGDANMDGTVNALDFNVVASNFGSTSAVWPQGDFTGDNIVNTADFMVLANNFGVVSPAPSPSLSLAGTLVPEPTGLGILAASGLLFWRRRRSGHALNG